MSEIRVNNITNREGSAGPSVAGIPVVDSNSHFVVPTGRTGQRYADGGENIVRDGLVLYLDAKYSYPGASGTNPDTYTWYDMSGNENNGELKNGVGYNAADGGSLSFDGVDDYVNFPGTASGILDFGTGNFSLCCWIKPGSGISGDGIINKRSGSRGYRLDIYSSQGIRMLVVGDAGVVVATNQIYTVGTWYYVVGVAENNTLKLYINSILQTQTATYSGTLSNSGVLEIGRMDANNAFSLDASVAQASIYNRALSAAEIQQNFNATKDRYGI